MKKYDIVALGECLIDFTPAGTSQAGMLLFERNPGGAPANMLVCAAKLGRKVAFIGKVGADMQGRFLRKTIQDSGVDTSAMVMSEDYFTTLAFVNVDKQGERSFSFARKPGADTQITEAELDMEMIRNTSIFHVGSLSMTDEPARSTTLAAITAARDAGAMISYDPNYRPLLWTTPRVAHDQISSLLPYADMIKISDDECEITTGHIDPREAARYLMEKGVSCVVITMGSKGAWIFTHQGDYEVPSYKPDAVVDTTGAGDSFWGAFLSCVAESGKNIKELTLEELCVFADCACAAASLAVEKRAGGRKAGSHSSYAQP